MSKILEALKNSKIKSKDNVDDCSYIYTSLFEAFKSVSKQSKQKTQTQAQQVKEAVDHPQHYQSKTGLEAIDVIEAFNLNFNLGNVIKYILRCGKKDADIQELEKAKWYLEREISIRKNSKTA